MSVSVVCRARRKNGVRLPALALVTVLAATSLASAGRISTPGIRVPDGYRVAQRVTLAKGVYHYDLVRRSPPQRVHVARVPATADAATRTMISRGRIAGPGPRLERTSAMCARVKCLAGVNGAFFTSIAKPLGAVVTAGEPVQSSRSPRPQFVIGPDRSLHLGKLSMATRLTARYPKHVSAADVTVTVDGFEEERSFPVSGINVYRKAGQVILYTPRMGPRTLTKRNGVELVAKLVGTPRVSVDRPITIRPAKLVWGGNIAVPKNGIVLSGHGDGADRLATLWRDVRSGRAVRNLTLTVTTSPATRNTIAGRPILLLDGKVRDPGRTSFARSRHPRTVVGWNAAGDVLLVTIDGRRPDAWGMSLEQAATLMKNLGAVAALNLDGGGSTTFVERGRVRNAPSDALVERAGRFVRVRAVRRGERVRARVERPVAVALVVVGT